VAISGAVAVFILLLLFRTGVVQQVMRGVFRSDERQAADGERPLNREHLDHVISIDDLEEFDPERRFAAEPEFDPEREFAETFNQAVYFVEIERYDEAEKKFRALIAADRHLSDSHYYLGKIHIAKENFTQAVIALTLAIKHEPDNALAYRLRSHVFTMLGESKRATADKKKADELAPPKETDDVTTSPSEDQ